MSTEPHVLAVLTHARTRMNWVLAYLPGISVCVVIALAATFMAEHHGGPQLLYALLMGLALHFMHGQPQAKKGIDFCGRFVLRLGVALLGVRITLTQVTELGLTVALTLVAAVILTIGVGVWLARRLGLGREEGLLSGGSVAICGASAALAISAVLPQTKANERFTLLAVVCVTVLSTVAMIVYPLLIQWMGMGAGAAGVFLGGTIHDVAQVVAAGLIVSPEAGDTATLVKLFRVMLLMPVVMCIAFLYRHNAQHTSAKADRPPLLPGFLMAFVALMLLASTGVFSPQVIEAATNASRTCLVLAIAAAGIKTSLEELLQLGWRPLLLFGAETFFIMACVLLAVWGLGLGAG